MGVTHKTCSRRDSLLSDGRSHPPYIAMQFSRLVLALSLVISLAICAPQGRSQNNSPNTRFFTGNQALDSAAAGAALGLGASVLSNQILNPCREALGTQTRTRTPTPESL